MKKIKYVLPFLTLLLAGCSSNNKTLTVSILTKPNTTINSTVVKQKYVNDYDIKEIPKVYANNYALLNSFEYDITGKTTTKIFITNVDQEIVVKGIKNGDYSYFYNTSSSNLYNTYHEAYYYNDIALYRDNKEDEHIKTDINTYLSKYGVYPFSAAIEGYLTNDNGIDSVELVENNNDEYTYKILFNNDSANNVKIQMKTFGGLDEYPNFSKIEILLKIKNDFTPISLTLESEYKTKKMVDVDCIQNYVMTFSNVGGNVEIPNLDIMKEKF